MSGAGCPQKGLALIRTYEWSGGYVRSGRLLALWCFGLALLGCSGEAFEGAECRQHSDCPQGEICGRGICVEKADGGVDTAVDGFDACRDEDGDGYYPRSGCGSEVDCDDSNDAVHPTAVEICDSLDNDCDGSTDEEFETLGDTCTVGLGPCEAEGTKICADDGESVTCDAEPLEGAEEVCDGLDNDCNGRVDDVDPESRSDDPAHCGGCGRNCVGMFENATAHCESGGCALKGCDDGYVDLDEDPTNGCEYRCDAALQGKRAESDGTCDGLDNDCDGNVDEDVHGMVGGERKRPGDRCTVGKGQCSARGTVVCAEISESAGDAGGGMEAGPDAGVDGDTAGSELVCDAVRGTPSPEICDDIDNDCDGIVDDGCDDDGDGYCDADLRSIGQPDVCPKGGGDCNDGASSAFPGARELCIDAIDNDCDEIVNEHCRCDFQNKSVGVCSKGQNDPRGNCQPPSDYQNPESGQCDQKDNDCDGVTDEGCSCTYDSDGDGETGDEAGICTRAKVDSRGRCAAPARYAPAESTCDGFDNDCDGSIDEGCTCQYKGLAVGVCGSSGRRPDGDCARPPSYRERETAQDCDGLDNDCDGVVDEGCPCDFLGRSVGVCDEGGTLGATNGSCMAPGAYVSPESAPGQCDRVDNDCDGVVDEGCGCVYDPTENDGDERDGDGSHDHGVCRGQTVDPTRGTCSRPAAFEIEEASCDGVDNDCDGRVDEDCNDDGDAYCDPYMQVSSGTTACSNTTEVDCADGSPGTSQSVLDWMDDTYPGAAPRDASGGCFRDVDGDDYGDARVPTDDRTNGIKGVKAGTDCDDGESAVRPGAAETTGDGVDANCDGTEICFADSDDDGFRTEFTVVSSDEDCDDPGEAERSAPSGDCLDSDPTVFPGAAPNDDPDACMRDADGDDYGSITSPPGGTAGDDCDDGNPGIHPKAPEACDGVDQDCDGTVDEGCTCTFDPTEPQSTDTDGSHAHGVCDAQSIGPMGRCGGGSAPGGFESPETTCFDGEDNDCNGATDCADGGCEGRRCARSGSECEAGACVEVRCEDGVNNDEVGDADCLDPDCTCPAGTICEDVGPASGGGRAGDCV